MADNVCTAFDNPLEDWGLSRRLRLHFGRYQKIALQKTPLELKCSFASAYQAKDSEIHTPRSRKLPSVRYAVFCRSGS